MNYADAVAACYARKKPEPVPEPSAALKAAWKNRLRTGAPPSPPPSPPSLLLSRTGKVRPPPMPPRSVPAADAVTPVVSQLQGTKLGIDLARARHVFGTGDGELRKLIDRALGAGGGDPAVFGAIRDRLLRHSSPDYWISTIGPALERTHGLSPQQYRDEAARLAHEYNWDRVGRQLDLDDVVAEYVHGVAGKRLRAADEVYRAAHNLFGAGSGDRRPELARHRDAFWAGLRDHVRGRAVGADTAFGLTRHDATDDKLAKSLRRLAERESVLSRLTPAAPVSLVMAKGAAVRRGVPTSRLKRTTLELHPAANPATRLSARGRPVYGDAGELVSPPKFLPTGLPTRAHQYVRDYAAAVKYGTGEGLVDAVGGLAKLPVDLAGEVVGRVARAIRSRLNRPNPPRLDGVRYRSHPGGRYSDKDALAAAAEVTALRHALGLAGLLPPRGSGETRRDHDLRVQAAVRSYLPEVRANAHADALGLGSHYYKTADRLRAATAGTDETEGGAVKRVSVGDAGVGVRELASAMLPLVRKVATDRGELPERVGVWREPPPPLPPEPVRGEEPLDLADVADTDDETAYNLLRDRPPHAESAPDGSEVPADSGHEWAGDDFHLPPVAGLRGDVVDEIESHPTPAPPPTAEENLHDATLHLLGRTAKDLKPLKVRTPPTRPRRQPKPKPDRPPTADTGDAGEDALRKRTADDKPLRPRKTRKSPKPLPRKSESPPEEPLQFAAYRAPAGGVVVRGTFYDGGSLIPDLEKFAAYESGDRPRRKPKRKSLRRALRLMRASAFVPDFDSSGLADGGGD